MTNNTESIAAQELRSILALVDLRRRRAGRRRASAIANNFPETPGKATVRKRLHSNR